MSTTPYTGIGDSFEFATVASPSTYTALDGVQSIGFSGDKRQTDKATTMASEDGVDIYVASTLDAGSLDVKCIFYPGNTSQQALWEIYQSGAAVDMKALYGSSNTSSFSGIVESMPVNLPLDKVATLDVKIKITGPITMA